MSTRIRGSIATPERQHLVGGLAVLAVVVLLAAPTIFLGRTLFPPPELPWEPGDNIPRDMLLLHLPLPELADRRLESGDLPLWNPYVALGVPLAASNYSLTFAPLQRALSWVEPFSRAVSWRLLLLAFLGGWALYGFLRLHGVGLLAGALGGALYALFALRYEPLRLPLAHYAGAGWALIGLFLLALAFTRRRPAWGAGAALAFGALCLTGHPHVVYFGYLLVGGYVLGTAIAAGRRDGPRRAAGALLLGGAALGLGAAIGAAQLLPTVANAARGTHVFDVEHMRHGVQLNVGRLASMMTFAWALVPFAALQRRWLPLLWLGLLVCTLGILHGTVLVTVLDAVLPFFGNFKWGTKHYVMPLSVLAPCLVAFGFERVVSFVPASRAGLRSLVAAALVPVALSPLLLTSLTATHAAQAPPGRVPPTLDCVRATRDAAGPLGRIIRYRTFALPQNLGMLWGLHDVAVSYAQLDRRYVALMIALNPSADTYLRYDGELTSFIVPEQLSLPVLDMLGAEALVAGEPVEAPGWEPVAADPDGFCYVPAEGWHVYRNVEALPRAWLVPGLRAVASDESAIAALTGPAFDPRGCALVTGPDARSTGDCDGAGRDLGDVAIVRYEDDVVELAVEAREPAVVVLADAWAPAWEVTIDDAPAPLLRVNLILRGVAVEPGTHALRFAYRPPAVRRGLAVSAVGLLALTAWAVGAAAARRRRRARREA